jgi:hypothetical protein
MKNLFLSAALVLALSANATVNTINTNDTAVTAKQEKEYTKTDPTKVSAEVLKAVSAKYSGYSLTEAYVAQDGEYKLVLAKDGKTVTAYYSAAGEFVKEA